MMRQHLSGFLVRPDVQAKPIVVEHRCKRFRVADFVGPEIQLIEPARNLSAEIIRVRIEGRLQVQHYPSDLNTAIPITLSLMAESYFTAGSNRNSRCFFFGSAQRIGIAESRFLMISFAARAPIGLRLAALDNL